MTEDKSELTVMLDRAVSDVMNDRVRRTAGVDLPELSWHYHSGGGTDASEMFGNLIELDKSRFLDGLRAWAEVLKLDPLEKRSSGILTSYRGTYDGVRVTISGYHPDA